MVENSNSATMARLVFGTVQLGMPYGIANRTGRPSQQEVNKILQEAWKAGIREFDTAQAYGASERVLGSALKELGVTNEAKIISKLDPALDHLDDGVVIDAVQKSLNRIGVPRLYGIMLHGEQDLGSLSMGLADTLRRLVTTGLVEHVGVSVYSPEKAIEALDSDVIDMVQVPANILDRRFERAGVFRHAQESGKAVYVRSVFLQGLLLMETEDLPNELSHARPILDTFLRMATELGMMRHEMALGYVKNKYPNARILFGAETIDQVSANCAGWLAQIPSAVITKADKEFCDLDAEIIDPSRWPNQ